MKNEMKPTGAASLPQTPSRLRMARTIRSALTAGLLLMATGCATSNYQFDALSEVSGHSRTEQLGTALEQEQEGGKNDDLYDMKMAPLFHTQLNVFARADEKGIPSGFVEADIDAYLPLLGFIDSTVQRYSDDHKMYERHKYNSYLWGLYQRHSEQIATPVGLRERVSRRLLWLLNWRSDPEYVEAEE